MNKNKQAVVMALLIASCASSLAAELDSDTFALVNGEKIKADVIKLIVGDSPVSPEQFGQLAERIVSNLVIAQEAVNDGLENDERVQSELALTRMQVLARAYISEFLEQKDISDEQVESKYEELKGSSSTSGLEYLSSHILVGTKEEADAAIEQIDGDPDKFAEVAAEISNDPGSAAQKGSLGWAPSQTYVPEFAAALESLQPGNMSSEPFQTQFGWHIVFVEDTREIEFPPLDAAQKQQILEQLRTELIAEEVERLVTSSEIEVNESLATSGN